MSAALGAFAWRRPLGAQSPGLPSTYLALGAQPSEGTVRAPRQPGGFESAQLPGGGGSQGPRCWGPPRLGPCLGLSSPRRVSAGPSPRPPSSGQAGGGAHLPPPQTQEAQVLKQLAERREHEREVLHKALEDNNNFSRLAEEKLNHKMELSKEIREAHLAALRERLREKELHAAEVRRNKGQREEMSG